MANKEMTAKIRMYLQVENNNKFLRGKKIAKEWIENYLACYYKLERPVVGDYIFFVPYKTLDGLKEDVYNILQEIGYEADDRNCVVEMDASCDELGIVW